MNPEILIGLFGGLALFIFGMHQMGEGLQKTAGDKMRNILAMLTSTPLKGVIVGALVTVIVQSSSATTVMVVGFVSAGLMTLSQSIGVIMGANIGTTITAWIVATKIDEYAWLFVAIGFILMFFVKKPKIKYLGQIIFAFGLLFVGLNTMGVSMKPLAKSQEFSDLLLSIKDIPILGVIVGAVSTMIVQSSSAAIGVLQTLGSTATDDLGTPLISLYQAIPILLGSNIGTTITAVLATIGGTRNAKRAAAAHAVFNLLGSVIFILLLRPYTHLVNFILGILGVTRISDGNTGIVGMVTPVADAMRESIAISHTVFNVVNTLLWLPFVWLMVKIVTTIVRGEDPIVHKKLAYIDYKVINSPAIAIDLSTNELARMTEIATSMIRDSHAIINKYDKELETRIFANEETLDYLENEIVRYLSHIFHASTITEAFSIRLAGLMHATNDIERIGDYCSNICDTSIQMKNNNLTFSEQAHNELDEAFALVEQMVDESIGALRNSDLVTAGKILSHEDEIDKMEDRLRESHLERLNNGQCDPKTTVLFLELIHTMERIGDHCQNIAEVVISGRDYKVHDFDQEREEHLLSEE
jgi:phosphate:Na+ symporter